MKNSIRNVNDLSALHFHSSKFGQFSADVQQDDIRVLGYV